MKSTEDLSVEVKWQDGVNDLCWVLFEEHIIREFLWFCSFKFSAFNTETSGVGGELEYFISLFCNLRSRKWNKGAWLGVGTNTGQYMIWDGDRVAYCRTMVGLNDAEKWKSGQLAKIRVTPWQMHVPVEPDVIFREKRDDDQPVIRTRLRYPGVPTSNQKTSRAQKATGTQMDAPDVIMLADT